MFELIAQVVLGILAVVIPLITKKWSDKLAADTAASKAATAATKLASLGIAMAGRAWDRLAPQVQAALADGTLTAEERAAIEATVKDLLKDFTSEDDLKALGEALGLPLPGVVAKIASYVIEKVALAHDKATPSVSSLAYPVKEDAPDSDPGFVVLPNSTPGEIPPA